MFVFTSSKDNKNDEIKQRFNNTPVGHKSMKLDVSPLKETQEEKNRTTDSLRFF